jgi:zinc transport system substrate-binding protein
VGVVPTLTISVLLIVLALAPACSPGDDREDGSVRVVSSFYPLFEAARRVGGERVEVSNLTPPGVEPHDVELTPTQVDVLEDANLVLYLGGGFQPAVEQVLARARTRALDLLSKVDVVDRDPHIWLDPRRMTAVIDGIEQALAEADPAGTGLYRDNARMLRAEVGDLDREFQAALTTCERRVFVTSHESFAYLAERYGLRQEAVAGLSPESEPDPERLAELADIVATTGTTTIFTETLVSPDVAGALAREARVSTAVLNPLEGLSEADIRAGRTYTSVMRDNLAALRAGLGCR